MTLVPIPLETRLTHKLLLWLQPVLQARLTLLLLWLQPALHALLALLLLAASLPASAAAAALPPPPAPPCRGVAPYSAVAVQLALPIPGKVLPPSNTEHNRQSQYSVANYCRHRVIQTERNVDMLG